MGRKIHLVRFYAAAAGLDPLTCPGCGAHRFFVTNTYWTRPPAGPKQKRRLRKCAACGHAQTETVPPPVVDGQANAQRN